MLVGPEERVSSEEFPAVCLSLKQVACGHCSHCLRKKPGDHTHGLVVPSGDPSLESCPSKDCTAEWWREDQSPP